MKKRSEEIAKLDIHTPNLKVRAIAYKWDCMLDAQLLKEAMLLDELNIN